MTHAFEETKKKIKKQVEAYSKVQKTYEEFALFINEVFVKSMHCLGINALISTRAKGKPNFAEKIIRKQNTCQDPVNQFTDLCGARVIVDFSNDIEPVCEFVRKYFDIDEANSEDVASRLGVSQFGYRSVHFIVSLNKDKVETLFEDMNLGPQGANIKNPIATLYQHRTAEECDRDKLSPGPKYKAEIQVRTLLQHAWAVFAHDRVYKSDFDVPAKWVRDTNRIAATLENSDNEFVRTIHGIENYRTYFGAYMTREKRVEELDKLNMVLSFDPENRTLAHQIARLAISIQKWDIAEEVLKKFVIAWETSEKCKELKSYQKARATDKIDTKNDTLSTRQGFPRDIKLSELLMDFGFAQYQRKQKKGKKYIEWSIILDAQNVDARVALADIHIQEKEQSKALSYFESAFRVAPSEPRVLGKFVVHKIISEKNFDFIPLIRPSLEKGISVCRDLANVGVYLPEAFYDIGMFSLLLGRSYESLNAFATAIQKSDTVSKIDETLSIIQDLQNSLSRGDLDEAGINIEWIKRFLLVTKVAKHIKMANGMIAKKKALEASISAFPEDQKSPENLEFQNIQVALKKISVDLDKALKFVNKEKLKELSIIATQNISSVKVSDPVIIIAGGCDHEFDNQIEDFKLLVEKAFDGYQGIIYAGGTTSGVSGFIGDLGGENNVLIQKKSYIPKLVPSDARIHDSFETIETDGAGFSALEPIQTWIDLLFHGINPSDVKLIGINGGQISQFEYRLALAMGAKVGIIKESGRAATEIFNNADWIDVPNLFELPNDPQSVRIFVQPMKRSNDLISEDRDEMAKEAHNQYRENQKKRYLVNDPAMADWENLTDSLKISNFHQIDHIITKLDAIGCTIKKVQTGTIKLKKFTKAEIEYLAEIEHGRWNVERILEGWKLGERDVSKKRTPYLVPWIDLPEQVREWDRQAVVEIPRLLKERGYEIIHRQ
ncbi:hypothetical protein JCM14469_01020 [Desulfatiferula olefinivorans]